MNPGGEPERDDTGLPPVDIEIPDDARELDRDVQAYFRELRAERRRQRRRRLHVGLTRDGVILPLLACCLILALITGTLLTVFTATSDQGLVPPPRSGTNSQPTPAVGPSLPTKPVNLPDVPVMVDGQRMFLPGMVGIMLVLIPPHCHCTTALSRLAAIGVRTHTGPLLVGTKGTIREARQLGSKVSRLSPDIASNLAVTFDSQGLLDKAVQPQGLTAVVISGPTSAGRGESAAYAFNVTSSGLSSSNSLLSVELVKALKG